MGYLEKKIGFCTDPGSGPPQNEDAVVCFGNKRETSEVEMVVGVADGLGRYAGGDIASAFLVDKLSQYFRGREYTQVAKDLGVNPKNLPFIYKLLLQRINEELYKRRQQDTDHPNMGSTFTGGLAYEMEIYLAHVGDSRAYRIRGGKISCLTLDHTMGAKLSRSGIEPESIPEAYANVLYRSFGYRPWIKIDFQILQILPNDFYCFLTDGCHNFLDDATLLKIIQEKEYDPAAVSQSLVQEAKGRGSKDNLSAACMLYINYMGLEMTKNESTARLQI